MSDRHVNDAALASKPLARAVASAFGKPSLLAAAAAGLALSPAAFAATYQVTNTNDSGSGSLRDAISQANANPGADTITFASNVTGAITLTSGSLYIYDGVSIQGPGASVLTLNGGASVTRPAAQTVAAGSVIVINDGGRPASPASALAATPVTISGLTITGGSSFDGGGVDAYNADLHVNNCVVTANYASHAGGGIYIGGYYSTLTVSNSTISNNFAYYQGGGVATEAAAITIQQSSLSGNQAKYGGGVFVHNDNARALTISNSTISGNSVRSYSYYYAGYNRTYGGLGAGVFVEHTGFSIGNSTIANNTADSIGGGVFSFIDDSGNYSATLSNSTVSGNSANYAGGIVQDFTGTINLRNTVVAGNTAGEDADAGTPRGGDFAAAFSLIGDTGGSTITDNGGNLLNVAPQLGALANNGGPTMTMLPLAGSPLIDAGDPAFSGLAADQRGYTRIVNGRVDIGATEFGAGPLAASTVPAPGLGLGGQLGLGALLGLAGLAVARRRRTLGAAAGIVLAAALAVSSPNAAHAAYKAQGGQVSRHHEATTITSYSVKGKIVTVVLGDGQTIKIRKGQVRTIDRRSTATRRQLRDPSALSSGTPAAVHYEIGANGKVRDLRIRLTDTLQQAQAFLAKRP